ncbi:MAG: plasmid mobilization relaxosome protein MobC [Bacteroidota bacterium]|nr:plasmid mobilization relaxosome protein MobC [Bacteroidota bacterium]
MTSEESVMKHTGGRPKKMVRKEISKGIRFTKAEYFIIKQKALKTDINVCAYIREIAIHGEIISRLNEEERNYVRQLTGMANNLSQLTKKAHQEGLFTVILLLEKYKNLVDEILEKMNVK